VSGGGGRQGRYIILTTQAHSHTHSSKTICKQSIYCFWVYEGRERVSREVASMNYVPTNIICRECRACCGC